MYFIPNPILTIIVNTVIKVSGTYTNCSFIALDRLRDYYTFTCIINTWKV
jgi:hypothetical protein